MKRKGILGKAIKETKEIGLKKCCIKKCNNPAVMIVNQQRYCKIHDAKPSTHPIFYRHI